MAGDLRQLTCAVPAGGDQGGGGAGVLFLPGPGYGRKLDRLLTASYMPNVTIGIIPLGVELEVVPAVAILVADDVVVEETPGNERTLRGDDATLYHRYADGLAAEAVTGD